MPPIFVVLIMCVLVVLSGSAKISKATGHAVGNHTFSHLNGCNTEPDIRVRFLKDDVTLGICGFNFVDRAAELDNDLIVITKFGTCRQGGGGETDQTQKADQ